MLTRSCGSEDREEEKRPDLGASGSTIRLLPSATAEGRCHSTLASNLPPSRQRALVSSQGAVAPSVTPAAMFETGETAETPSVPTALIRYWNVAPPGRPESVKLSTPAASEAISRKVPPGCRRSIRSSLRGSNTAVDGSAQVRRISLSD